MSIRFNGPPNTKRPEPPPLRDDMGRALPGPPRRKKKIEEDPHMEEEPPTSTKLLKWTIFFAIVGAGIIGIDHRYKVVMLEDDEFACSNGVELGSGIVTESTPMTVLKNRHNLTGQFNVRTVKTNRLFQMNYDVTYDVDQYHRDTICKENLSRENLDKLMHAIIASKAIEDMVHYDSMRYSVRQIKRKLEIPRYGFPNELDIVDSSIQVKRIKDSVK